MKKKRAPHFHRTFPQFKLKMGKNKYIRCHRGKLEKIILKNKQATKIFYLEEKFKADFCASHRIG